MLKLAFIHILLTILIHFEFSTLKSDTKQAQSDAHHGISLRPAISYTPLLADFKIMTITILNV